MRRGRVQSFEVSSFKFRVSSFEIARWHDFKVESFESFKDSLHLAVFSHPQLQLIAMQSTTGDLKPHLENFETRNLKL